jgi:hypothetical protein
MITCLNRAEFQCRDDKVQMREALERAGDYARKTARGMVWLPGDDSVGDTVPKPGDYTKEVTI